MSARRIRLIPASASNALDRYDCSEGAGLDPPLHLFGYSVSEIPPSTVSTWPFTYDAASEARNTAAPPISRGSAQRPSGVRRQTHSLNSLLAMSAVFSSVAT